MIGGIVLIRRVFAGLWARVGGLLPIIGGIVLIWRFFVGFGARIGGLLPIICGIVLTWRVFREALGPNRRVADDDRRHCADRADFG